METIPENSTTSLEFKDSTQRFSGAPWFQQAKKTQITVVGAGGIGSHTVFMLSRLQPNHIYLYDGDNVEAVNMAGQFYNKYSIGLKKSYATANLVEQFSDYKSITACSFNIEPNYNIPETLVTICGLDNMAARKLIFKKWQDLNKFSNENRLFIDGRLAAEELQIYAVTSDDDYSMAQYQEKYLFDDKNADSTLCSYKQTSYCASMIGSLITNIVVNYLTNIAENQDNPLMKRPVPFYTYYDASLMYFKTEL